MASADYPSWPFTRLKKPIPFRPEPEPTEPAPFVRNFT